MQNGYTNPEKFGHVPATPSHWSCVECLLKLFFIRHIIPSIQKMIVQNMNKITKQLIIRYTSIVTIPFHFRQVTKALCASYVTLLTFWVNSDHCNYLFYRLGFRRQCLLEHMCCVCCYNSFYQIHMYTERKPIGLWYWKKEVRL